MPWKPCEERSKVHKPETVQSAIRSRSPLDRFSLTLKAGGRSVARLISVLIEAGFAPNCEKLRYHKVGLNLFAVASICLR